MEYLPFQNFIDTTPKQYIIPKGKHEVPDTEYRYVDGIEKILSSLNVETELNKLKSELFKIDESRHFLYVKLILEDLINTYFTIRKEIFNIDEGKDLQRKLMLEIYNAIVAIIVLLNRMNINIPDDFITDYEKRDRTGIIIGTLKMFDSQNKKPQSVLNITKIFDENKVKALFEGLKRLGIISSAIKEDHFLYVFNGGIKPSDYNKLNVTKGKSNLFVYLISELFTDDSTTDWRVSHEFNVKNPAQKKTNYYNNKNNRPKHHEQIDNLLRETNLK